MEGSEVASIVDEIKTAFADVPYPGDDNITGPSFYGDEGVSDYFKGTTQEGHSARSLRVHQAALFFFLPEAYRYFLPAFLIADLTDPEEADTIDIALRMIFSGKKASSVISLLTPAQRHAVERYFEYCLSHSMNDDGRKENIEEMQIAIDRLK